MTQFVLHFFCDGTSEQPLAAFVELIEYETHAPTLGCHDSVFTVRDTGRMCVVDGSLSGKWYEPGEWETLYNDSVEETKRDVFAELARTGSFDAEYVSNANAVAFVCRNDRGIAA